MLNAREREQWIVVAVLSAGTVGCLLALFGLSRIRNRGNNESHRFLLRCLIVNDCAGLAGLLVIVVASECWPPVKTSVWTCRSVVLLRFCGLASGSVAAVMAVERWLALTKPFFYESHVTYSSLKRIVFALWLVVMCLVIIPLLGFGNYYNKESRKCYRVRDSQDSFDVGYAYLLFGFGNVLWLIIACMNLDVIKTMCTKEKHDKAIGLNRGCHKTSIVRKEERAFAVLMLTLCFSFVVSWLPQMISLPLSQLVDDEAKRKKFHEIADVLIVIHFSLDPYLYVLQQWKVVKLIFMRPKNRLPTL